MDDLTDTDFDRHYRSLEIQYDELVKTCLVGKSIIDELQGESVALDLLLTGAKEAFINAALVMINGDLNFATEAGIAKAVKAQDDLRVYQIIVNRIAEAIARARDAKQGAGYLKEEMKVRYDDG
jgi:hypothetical protein